MATYSRISLNICNCLTKRLFSSTPRIFRLKALWRVDRQPANTKLADETVVERRKAYGGKEKFKAISASEAKYTVASQKIEDICKIIEVLHSDAGPWYRNDKIMALGTYVVVDATPLMDKVTAEQLVGEDISLLDHVTEMLNKGQLYAKVTSRPGQVGNCDGVIVEGSEIASLIEKLKMYEAEEIVEQS